MGLTFDAATHTYRWKGVVVRSVTQVIEDAMHTFARVPGQVLEVAQLRGTNVHLACQYHDEDCLDESEFTLEELGYLAGWRRFLVEHEPNFTAIEKPFYNEVYGYPGTPDRDGSLLVKGGRAEDANIDIKTGTASSPTWGIQTAAYVQGKPRRRFTVQLSSDGNYKLLEWTDPMDWPAFVSLLTFNRWKRKHNL